VAFKVRFPPAIWKKMWEVIWELSRFSRKA